jgi:protein-disulfide isomerase
MIAAGSGVLWVVLGSGDARPAADTSTPLPVAEVSLAGTPRIGRENAPVVMVEFSDFECAFCGKLANEILPVLKQEYVNTGVLEIAFRHLPLTKIHRNAAKAANAADCAKTWGKFWEYHDALFTGPGSLTDEVLRTQALAVGLNSTFWACSTEAQIRPQVKADTELANSLNVRSTPVSMIGRRGSADAVRVSQIVVGAQPLADFRRAIESVAR